MIKLTKKQVKALENVLEYADTLCNEAEDYFSAEDEDQKQHIYLSLRELAKLVYGKKCLKDFEKEFK